MSTTRFLGIRAASPLLLFLGLNALLFAVASLLGTPRGYLLNIDHVFPSALLAVSARGPGKAVLRVLIAVLLSAFCLIDAGAFASRYYLPPDIIPSMAWSIRDWPWKVLAPGMLIVTGLCWLLGRVAPLGGGRPALVLLSAVVALGLAADVVGGRNSYVPPAQEIRLPNIVSSGMRTMFEPIIAASSLPWKEPVSLANTLADRVVPGAGSRRILSVGVESWGIAKAVDVQAALNNVVISGLAGHYRVKAAEARHADGGTLVGEMRELCGFRTQGIPIAAQALASLQSCLPARLSAMGYETWALHGNTPSFYNRRFVYPAMGFQHTRFKADLLSSKADVCGDTVFGGICDRSTFADALSHFKPTGSQMVHVMTLDTHLPMPIAGTGCDAITERTQRQVCIYRHHIADTLQALVDSVNAAATPPDLIVIYGDHSPPFSRPTRDSFEDYAVPYLELTRIAD